ncbi:SUMF1/EgtB/PvdO family nonheme iron enzyme [Undibacterium arcticum]|uniref:SUMF1/EgtB/PvdO family nonheme iron enzyme n=1 Tax=Undibacterium arcticum TaxID=1762892 RepID=A0ABV7EZJ5_9BURK
MNIELTQEHSFTVRAGANAVRGLFHVDKWEGLDKYADARGQSLILNGDAVVTGSPDLLFQLRNGPIAPGFVPVPETKLPGGIVVPAFQVAQYVSSDGGDGKVEVSATAKPWTKINFQSAKQACTNAGYSMITETQWLAIAYNASQQAENWTEGRVGHGTMFQGIRKGNVSSAQPGDFQSKDPEERRWLVLSNGSRICDFNGNVFQWVFDDVQGDEQGLIAKTITLESPSQSTAPYPSDKKGLGYRPDSARDWSGRALIRGGCCFSDDYAGAFNLGLDWPDDDYGNVGFRCTK